MLSLPFAFASAGVVLGPLLLLVIALSSDFSIYILMSCSRRSDSHSYEDVARRAFGKTGQMITLALLVRENKVFRPVGFLLRCSYTGCCW